MSFMGLLSVETDLFKVSGLFPVAVLLIIIAPPIPVSREGFVMAPWAWASIEQLVGLAAEQRIVPMPVTLIEQASAIWKCMAVRTAEARVPQTKQRHFLASEH